jgi:glycerate kinase
MPPRDADLIITGEGHPDGQSAQGKLIQGPAAAPKQRR